MRVLFDSFSRLSLTTSRESAARKLALRPKTDFYEQLTGLETLEVVDVSDKYDHVAGLIKQCTKVCLMSSFRNLIVSLFTSWKASFSSPLNTFPSPFIMNQVPTMEQLNVYGLCSNLVQQSLSGRDVKEKKYLTIEHLELPMWSKISSPRKMLDEVRCRQLFVNFLSKYVSISSLNFQISDSFLRFQMVKILKVRDEAEFILKVVSSSKFPWNKLKELHLTLIFDGTDEVIERSGILVSVKIFFLAGFVCRDANFMLG